ncbi:MAG: FG-GAP repeat protein, partial [Myxococcota bacterium]
HNGASWVENEKILPEGVPIGMLGYTTFGGNMEMRGLWAMVGLSQVAAGQGRVVPLKRAGGGWVQQPLLPAVEPSAFSYFGSSLAIDDDLMLVGAPGVHQPGRLQDTGAVYVFQLEADEWMQQQEILAPETKALLGDLFGAGLALQKGSAFVGAPRSPFTVALGGGVYAFDGVPFDDCNGNSIDDACDIESGVSADVDGDEVPDECARPCLGPADLDCNGIVNGLDLGLLLGAWGKCAGGSGCTGRLERR